MHGTHSQTPPAPLDLGDYPATRADFEPTHRFSIPGDAVPSGVTASRFRRVPQDTRARAGEGEGEHRAAAPPFPDYDLAGRDGSVWANAGAGKRWWRRSLLRAMEGGSGEVHREVGQRPPPRGDLPLTDTVRHRDADAAELARTVRCIAIASGMLATLFALQAMGWL